MDANIIEVGGLKYQAIKPIDEKCSVCDLRDTKCWDLCKSVSCLPSDREDNEYVNFKLIKENTMTNPKIIVQKINDYYQILKDGINAGTFRMQYCLSSRDRDTLGKVMTQLVYKESTREETKITEYADIKEAALYPKMGIANQTTIKDVETELGHRVNNLITYVQMEIDAPYKTDALRDEGYNAAYKEILAKLKFCLRG